MSATPTEPNANDIMSMQQEAMKRVQEMQGRARRTVGIDDADGEATPVSPARPVSSRRSPRQKQDNETTLITLLLLILMAENASPELTFALLYLLAG